MDFYLKFFNFFRKDPKKAESPFLTQNPREIYKTKKIDVDGMFGCTSSVSFSPHELISWVKMIFFVGIFSTPQPSWSLQLDWADEKFL